MKPSERQAGAFEARVQITTEIRRDHAEALRRLGEVAIEEKESLRFVIIAGWPAAIRRRREPLPTPGAEMKKPSVPSGLAARVTIVVAVAEILVRLEGTVVPGANEKIADEIESFGLRLEPGNKGDARKSEEEIQQLQKTLPKPPAASETLTKREHGNQPKEKLGVAVNVQAGVGELEVAVNNNGQNVVIAANSGFSNSTNSGATFTPRGGLSPGFPLDGDPSLAFGQSNAFYYGFIGFPNGTTAAGGVSGCSDSLAVSTDNGVTFPFRSHAVLCPNTGTGVCFPDQEHIAADPRNSAPAPGGDQVYFVWRNFVAGSTATSCGSGPFIAVSPRIVCSTDGGTTWGTSQNIGTGDFPRISVGPDGAVYVVFLSGGNIMLNRFSSCSAGLVQQTGFPVTVASFTAVTCPVSGLDRCNNGNTLASPTVAVDDLDVNHVYVAFASTSAAGNENVIVRDSTDGGLTFPRSVTVNTSVTGRRFMPWVCAVGGVAYVSWYDRRNATSTSNDLTAYFGGSAAVKGGSLVAGTEINISGVNDSQCSTWPCTTRAATDCSSCPTGTTCPAVNALGGCPKYGDYNGAACGTGNRYNAWASATPPTGVTAPGTGINVYANVNAVPSDFFVRDWTVDANNHDLGPEPSTNPVFFQTSDVWNQNSSSTAFPFVSDWVVGEGAIAGGATGDNNFGFARVSRRSAAAATAAPVSVNLHFYKGDYGLGTNFVDAGSAVDPTLTFNAGDLTKTLASGYPWRLDTGASFDVCLAVEISAPNDAPRSPSLTGGAPGPSDPLILQDNNKAQRNLSTTDLGVSSGGAYYAIIHNPDLITRNMVLEYRVPGTALRELEGTRVGIVGSQEQVLSERGALVLEKMKPGEFRWVEVVYDRIHGKEGELLPITFSEVLNASVVNGFTIAIRPSPLHAVLRGILLRERALLYRFALLIKQSQAKKLASETDRFIAAAKNSIDEKEAILLLKGHAAPMVALVQEHMRQKYCPSPYHAAHASRLTQFSRALIDASSDPDSSQLLGAYQALLAAVDAHLSMMQKAEGDPADMLQMVRLQKSLFEQKSRLTDAKDIVAASDSFIEGYRSRKLHPQDYDLFIARVAPALNGAAKQLRDEMLISASHQLLQKQRRSLALLEKLHHDYLLRLAENVNLSGEN